MGYIWGLLDMGSGGEKGGGERREKRKMVRTGPAVCVVAEAVEKDERCWVGRGGGRGDALGEWLWTRHLWYVKEKIFYGNGKDRMQGNRNISRRLTDGLERS